MFVQDRYSQAEPIDRYRSEPGGLAEELPHRYPGNLELVAKSIAVIEWRETLQLIPPSHEIADVLEEFHHRVRRLRPSTGWLWLTIPSESCRLLVIEPGYLGSIS